MSVLDYPVPGLWKLAMIVSWEAETEVKNVHNIITKGK